MNSGDFSILLVEDQVRFQKIYAEAISENLHAKVHIATGGNEAYAIINSAAPPDLVILDLEIPGMNGQELLANMRRDHHLSQIPVIILTGRGGEDAQMEMLEQGADDFIEKGGSPAILIARVRAQMRHKLAVDRLERLALDRDLFAAAVLQDIGASRGTITSLCQQARAALLQDDATEVLVLCDRLSTHASQLGSYAHDVIQSVRDSQHVPKLLPLQLDAVLAWAAEVTQGAFTYHASTPLASVLGDQTYVRLALLNIVQRALRGLPASGHLVFSIEQSDFEGTQELSGRRYLKTRFRDNGKLLAPADVVNLFKPHLRYLGTQDDAGDASSDHGAQDDDQGFSIGLSVVAKVMMRMGGRIWAEREENPAGTSIFLVLPAG